MPTTRRTTRSTSGSGSGPGGKQSTLSFNHRVTKNSVSKSVKDSAVLTPSGLKKEIILPEPEQVKQEPIDSPVPTTDDDHDQQEEEQIEEVKEEVTKSVEELKAEKLSNAAIERYWRTIEAGRMATKVHQKHAADLTTGEKVLRYFDVSSQFGPCIGTTRLKRWQRAQRLGLNPPIEVLAVLLQEEAKRNGNIERAHMDELLNSVSAGP
ncbi:DNA polymerase delta subunit 4 [Diplogelasinospora grovesii]|uniref:DNA polymerase delta subunit 4 n=1 Tax=Diplogelasinospora grovesii TaxID=303347 RepID=A0AAN6N2D3_9PEZI|nr:DNA polymerase delta subunit 4 [Diplogelasinospora grovesii]